MVNLSIKLSPKLEKIVQERLESGQCRSAREVVETALALMVEIDCAETVKFELLRAAIHEGLNSGHAGRWNPAKIKRLGRIKRWILNR